MEEIYLRVGPPTLRWRHSVQDTSSGIFQERQMANEVCEIQQRGRNSFDLLSRSLRVVEGGLEYERSQHEMFTINGTHILIDTLIHA